MRTVVLLALVVAACGPSDRDGALGGGAPSAAVFRGPDPLMLRVPRAGGTARVSMYPRLDSLVWSSLGRVPALDRILAFDPEGGTIAVTDGRGFPGRLELRLGTYASTAQKARPLAVVSTDGAATFEIDHGQVVRLTASESWRVKTPVSAAGVFPQPDGTILITGNRADKTLVWRLRPPDESLLDTIELPRVSHSVHVQAGDRLYFSVDSGLIGVRGRDLTLIPSIRFEQPIRALAATPSGDRLFVSLEDDSVLRVVDRYRDRSTARIEIPSPASQLRMDPLGRYLLAKSARADTAYVIALGTARVTGAVRTAWRSDLPLVAPDGSVALIVSKDVLFVDGESLRPGRTVADGASDIWYSFHWTGFRPRAEGLDEPVTFGRADSAAAGGRPDSTAAVPPPAQDTAPTRPPLRDSVRAAPAPTGFTLSFATFLSEPLAHKLASDIRVKGASARVVTSQVNGQPVFRVIMGPYETRAEAERVGRASERSYWVYEGAP